MSTNSEKVLALYSILNSAEQQEVLNAITSRPTRADAFKSPSRPMRHKSGHGRSVYGSDNNINFAPAPGQRCPTCGK